MRVARKVTLRGMRVHRGVHTLSFTNGLDADAMSGSRPHQLSNLVGGKWVGAQASYVHIHKGGVDSIFFFLR